MLILDRGLGTCPAGWLRRSGADIETSRRKLFAIASAVAARDGGTLNLALLTGGGANDHFTADVSHPTLDGRGVDGDGAHARQEYALISTLLPRQKLFERLLASELAS